MSITDSLYSVRRKEGDKCPWCNHTDVVKGLLVLTISKGTEYYRCNRRPLCKFHWKQPVHIAKKEKQTFRPSKRRHKSKSRESLIKEAKHRLYAGSSRKSAITYGNYKNGLL